MGQLTEAGDPLATDLSACRRLKEAPMPGPNQAAILTLDKTVDTFNHCKRSE
jgi:hypothetical protein